MQRWLDSHTKRAVGYNAVKLVYARRSAASQLDQILQRHAEAISRLDSLLVAPVLHEAAATSTSPARAPVLQTDVAEYLLGTIRERMEAGCFTPVYPSTVHHAAQSEHIKQMAGVDCTALRRRAQYHQLLGLVIAVIDDADHRGFRQRCDQMLRTVPQVRNGAWARRTHIFKHSFDLRP